MRTHTQAAAHRQSCITLATNGQHETTVYLFQDYPFSFPPPPPMGGLSWAVGFPRFQSQHCCKDQGESGGDMVGRRKESKEQNCNHSAHEHGSVVFSGSESVHPFVCLTCETCLHFLQCINYWCIVQHQRRYVFPRTHFLGGAHRLALKRTTAMAVERAKLLKWCAHMSKHHRVNTSVAS